MGKKSLALIGRALLRDKKLLWRSSTLVISSVCLYFRQTQYSWYLRGVFLNFVRIYLLFGVQLLEIFNRYESALYVLKAILQEGSSLMQTVLFLIIALF